MATPFLITPEVVAALQALREQAMASPVHVPTLIVQIQDPAGKQRHKDQMNRQSLKLPFDFLVTFSIETGHQYLGTCRHMSMSSPVEGRLPTRPVVWMTAELLGFVGGLEACHVSIEQLTGHGRAIALVQSVATQAPSPIGPRPPRLQ